MDRKKLMIIDGNSIINRAFYGIRMLTNSEGLYTNAIYGFLNIYFKYLEEENPEYVCVAFDMKAPTFRHKEFEQYKAHRKGMPEELAVQLPVLKDVLKAMNIAIYEKEGYEADDLIGTVSRICEEEGFECVVVTGDRDSLQLVSSSTRVKLPITRKGTTITDEYDDKKVFEKYGVTPTELIDVKGLMGDSSDNIPGVKGIGEKTAISLIQKYSSIENIYENIDTIELRAKMKESLMENKEIAFLSKELATIDRNVPMDIKLSDCLKTDYNKEKLLELFQKLEFKSFISKLQLESSDMNSYVSDEEFKQITSRDQFKDVIEHIIKTKEMRYVMYYENNPSHSNLMSIAIAINQNTAAYIDITEQLTTEDVIGLLKLVFENENVKKIGHNLKEDIVFLHSYGIQIKNIAFDTMIGAYILNPSRNSYFINELAQEFLGLSIPSDETIFGKGKSKVTIKDIDHKTAVEFAGKQVLAISHLVDVLKEKITENQQEHLYYNVELPLVEVLAEMQILGFYVDKEKLIEFSSKLDQRIQELTSEIYNLAGEEFNINSPKQLGVILFEKLNLPIIKKTKTGYSTNIEVLEKLKDKHKIISLLIEYRQLVKLKSTYADGLVHVINPKTGKIHSSFNQTVTTTGRISSTDPNLQNIPVKLELGREIRKMFTASNEEYILIDADYSQIELRVLAHISGDPNMIEAFKQDKDIHTITASQVFGVPMEEVTALMRNRAKAVNFGIVYGIGDFSLSQDLGISRKEAKQYIDNYLSKYKLVHQYMIDIVEIGKKQGYVTTLLNRRRYLPELQAKNYVTRSFGERVAMNTPIQGSAADIIKIAMVNVYKKLKEKALKSKLILQVHDELIIETHKSEIEEVKEIIKTEMENAMTLKVPLKVDISMGYSWYDAK